MIKDKARKSLFVMMAALILLALTACGAANSSDQTAGENVSGTAFTEMTETGSQAVDNTESTEGTAKRIFWLFVFHIQERRKAMQNICMTLWGGDLIELEPAKEYPAGYSAALDPAKQEQRENARPALKTAFPDFDSYDTVYLGYPIWWGTVPMVVNTFLESYDFTGKTVIPFATSGGTVISQSITDIKNEIPNATVMDALRVQVALAHFFIDKELPKLFITCFHPYRLESGKF